MAGPLGDSGGGGVHMVGSMADNSCRRVTAVVSQLEFVDVARHNTALIPALKQRQNNTHRTVGKFGGDVYT